MTVENETSKTNRSRLITLFNHQELDDLYGIPAFNEREQSHYFALDKNDLKFINKFSTIEERVYALLCLGYFRAKTYLIDFNYRDVTNDRRFIMSMHFPRRNVPKSLPPKHKQIRIQNKILEHEKFKRYDSNLNLSIQRKLNQLVKIHPKAKQLVKVLLKYLAEKRIALPSYTRLQRLISDTLNTETSKLARCTVKSVSGSQLKQLSNLLKQTDKLHQITNIKRDIKNFQYAQMCQEIKKHQQLRPLFDSATQAIIPLKLPNNTIEYYGSLINFYSVSKLKRMTPEKSNFYLLCYSISRYQKLNDNLLKFFKYFGEKFHVEAKNHAKDCISKANIQTGEIFHKVSNVLDLFINNDSADTVSKEKAFSILSKDEMRIAQQQLTGQILSEDHYYWEYIDSIQKQITMNLRPLFMNIDFLVRGKSSIEKIISELKLHFSSPTSKSFEQNRQKWLSIIPPSQEQYFLHDNAQDHGKEKTIIKNRFEFFLYRKILLQIGSGKIFLQHSHDYKHLEDDIIPKKTWETDHAKIIKKVGCPKLTTPIERILQDHESELDKKIIAINEHISKGENKCIKIQKNSDKTIWTLPYKKYKDETNNPFFTQMPQFSIVDILHFVNQHCGFLKSFTPIQPKYAKNKRNNSLLSAVILANAVRIGSRGMANISDLSFSELSVTESTYIRLETLREAIDDINNATAKLPIFKHWNIFDYLHGSLDGCKIGTRINTLKARYSPKYLGLNKGVVAYNMIVNHLPVNGRAIGANEHESHFMFDLTRNNTSDIKPKKHSGDGHSVNQVNFALFDFADEKFMPHFPTIHKKPIYCFGDLEKFKDCIIQPAHRIKKNLIIKEWPNATRIIASLFQGNVTQSTIVKKLSSHQYYSKTKNALWEYDNIIKSFYILDYIDDVKIRQSVRQALNRGEAYHQLCRAIAYINGGKFRGGSELEIAIWNDCARLIASAIIYYNSYILSALLDRAKTQKEIDLIISLSPVAWQHINLLGQYEFTREPIQLRISKLIKELEIKPKVYVGDF